MKLVYLDQNKWIELSQVEQGKSDRPRDLLDFVRGARDMGLACFPLSLVHYMETWRRGNRASRIRLADFMLDVSGGKTIAWGPAILRFEIEQALHRRFPQRVRADRLMQLELLGEGMGHARHEPILAYSVPEYVAERLSAGATKAIEESVKSMIEQALLRGQVPLTDECPPQHELADVEADFNANLQQVIDWLRLLAPGQLDLGLHLMAMTDIVVPLGETLALHGVATHEFLFVGEAQVWRFIDDLPTQRVAMHVLRQWVRNAELRPKRNDLYDWMALVPAAVYCDVVVTEKLFADLVNRPAVQSRAQIITNLDDLPPLLTQLSR